MTDPLPLVLTRKPNLVAAVLRAAKDVAYVYCSPSGIGKTDRAQKASAQTTPPDLSTWGSAPLVLVGTDIAAEIAAMRLPRRTGVVLLGDDLDDATVWESAVNLGAEHVAFTPEGDIWLRERIAAGSAPAADSIAVGNARENDFFRKLTDRGIDPYEPAGPDADDLVEED